MLARFGEVRLADLFVRGVEDLANDLTVLTRNTVDFTGTGVRLKNLFAAPHSRNGRR